jgi:DNA-binding response OmpR family regulator
MQPAKIPRQQEARQTVPAHILVVDDEPTVRAVVSDYLRLDGARVTEADNGHKALEILAKDRPDVVVLDVMLPEVDGLEVLRSIRSNMDLPVILLTARTSESDRVTGLDLGADDYVMKPFSPRELAARVRSILRRTKAGAGGNVVELGNIVVDEPARKLQVAGRTVDTTPREFELMAYMVNHRGRVFSRAELLDAVWQSSPEWQDPSTVTVHIRKLRRKIERDPNKPLHLKTVWGVGYRFDA